MNKPTLLLICAYFSAFHMFQVTAIENSMISATFEIPTTYHSKKDVNENKQSLSSCFSNQGIYNSPEIICSPSGPLLAYSFCATYNEDTKYYLSLNVYTFNQMFITSRLIIMSSFPEISVSSMTTCAVH